MTMDSNTLWLLVGIALIGSFVVGWTFGFLAARRSNRCIDAAAECSFDPPLETQQIWYGVATAADLRDEQLISIPARR